MTGPSEESTEIYRLFFQNARDAILLVDPNGGRILEANAAALSTYRYPREEFLSLTVFDLRPQDSRGKIAAQMEEALAAGTLFETFHKRKDGGPFPVEVGTRGATLGGKPVILSIVRDITERKRSEQALRESEVFFQALLDASEDIAFLTDGNAVILAANETFCRRMGKHLDQVIGIYALDLLSGPVRQERERRFKEALSSGKTVRFTDCYRDRWWDNVIYPKLDAAGKVSRAAVFSQDITRSKQDEQALRQSEEKYRTLVELSLDAIYIQCERKFVFVNKAGLDLFGAQTCAQIIGKDVLELMHPEWRDVVAGRIRLLREGVPAAPLEEQYLRLDGAAIDVEVLASPFTYEGKPAALVLARDITQRKRAEQALRESEQQLRQAQKMEAIGRLAGGVAHDFNNQLTIVLGYCDVLSHRMAPDDPLRPVIAEIARAAERSATVTRHLLSFSRKQMIHATVLDPAELLSDLKGTLSRIIPEDTRLTFAVGDAIGHVKTDKGLFEQALMNLVLNARDAMPSGGEMTVQLRNVILDDAAAAAQGAPAPGRYVMASVTDTGTGLDDATLQRAFEPFFTTKPVGRGTGLGLAMVYGYATQSGGFASASSTPGRGATFNIFLPTTDVRMDAKADRAGGETGARGAETVLVVEDDDSVRDFAARSLKGYGYSVTQAATPADALRIAEGLPEGPDILVADVVMPEMSGVDLARHLAAVWPSMKVLFITGYAGGVVGDSFPAEHARVLSKPFTTGDLAQRVRETLDSA